MKKTYEKIIDKRFIVSIIGIIAFCCIGLLKNSFDFNEIIFSLNTKFCLWWNVKLFLILLVTYELMLEITENKNSSFFWSIILISSGFVLWNINNIDALIIGEFATVLVQKFFNQKKKSLKILIMIGIIALILFYSLTFKPFAIPLFYLFVAMIIWLFFKNINVKGKEKIALAIPMIIASIMCFAILRLFNTNVEYFGIESDSYTFANLFSYLFGIFLPYGNLANKELLGSIISVFPIPLLISLIYLFKNEKHIEFLMPMSIVAVLEIVFCMSGFPEFLNKISGFDMTNTCRTIFIVQLANFYMMIYLFSNVKEPIFKIKTTMYATLVVIALLIFMPFPTVYSSRIYLNVFAMEMTALTFLLFNYKNASYEKMFKIIIFFLTMISGIPVWIL